MYIGAPACGMNAAARAFVRMGLTQGCKVLGIRYGFEGLMQHDVSAYIRYKNCVSDICSTDTLELYKRTRNKKMPPSTFSCKLPFVCC